MNPKMNYKNLTRQLLPPHKRQPNRMAFLRGLIAPLQSLFDSFNAYRNDSRMMFNVNSQVKVLEGYLRKKYNDCDFRCRIVECRAGNRGGDNDGVVRALRRGNVKRRSAER